MAVSLRLVALAACLDGMSAMEWPGFSGVDNINLNIIAIKIIKTMLKWDVSNAVAG